MKEKFENLTIKQKIILIILILIVATTIIIAIYRTYSDGQGEIIVQNVQETNNIEENSTQIGNKLFSDIIKKGKIMIDVTGAVNEPGVVILNEGSRIIDAINAAGGKTEEADTSKINLAYILEDGVQIYIPKIGEKSEAELEAEKSGSTGKKEYIKTDAGEGIITETATNDNTKTTTETKININTADKEKLKTLNGIGDSMAQKIIEYREKNGKFATIEDIKKVSGIGESKFNNIKTKIVVK